MRACCAAQQPQQPKKGLLASVQLAESALLFIGDLLLSAAHAPLNPLPGLPAAALDLINEPRCYQCGTALQQWVQEMAAYVKSLDANHLLTVRCWAQTNRQGRHHWQLLAPHQMMRGMCVCTTALKMQPGRPHLSCTPDWRGGILPGRSAPGKDPQAAEQRAWSSWLAGLPASHTSRRCRREMQGRATCERAALQAAVM